MKLGRSGGNTQVFSLTYGFTRVMRSCDCACNREADTAGLEPAASHCVDTVVDAGALPIRAICPVILFWATSWANHPRGGQTPFTDRGGQWFRGRTNPDCQKRLPVELPGAVAPSGRRVLYGLLLKQEYIEVVESFFGRAVSNGVLIVLLRAAARSSLVSGQGSHPPLCRELRR